VTQFDRAAGALYGLAIGDALGMPTQMMSREEVVSVFGKVLVDFEPAPTDHPIAEGMTAGRITDDTEQAVLLASELIDGHGEVDIQSWADALIAWEESMKAKGSLDLLGPSTKRAINALLAGGDPEEVGRRATPTVRRCASHRSRSRFGPWTSTSSSRAWPWRVD